MEGASSPLPGEELELWEVQRQPNEQTPLKGAVQIIPFPALEPSPAQAKQKSPWSSCNRKLFGKCKLWMAILSIFVGLIIMIIISLCLMKVTYIDEDENETLELSANKTFLVTLKIPEECVTEEELPHLLQERLVDVYSSSPSLSRYFTSVETNLSLPFRGENATITYHLQFGVPLEDKNFMKYMMSEELVLGILLQDFHGQNLSGCETLELDPESLLLYGKTLHQQKDFYSPYYDSLFIVVVWNPRLNFSEGGMQPSWKHHGFAREVSVKEFKSEVVEVGLCLKAVIP